MLDGIRSNQIIVGAYTDSQGGICPMLAAHRNGGRTTLLAFARAWDSFAGARRVRAASRRELRVLERELTASLSEHSEHSEPTDLSAAITDHVELRDRSAAAAAASAPAEQEQIRATRLGGGRVRLLRPRRGDAERALAHLDQHVLAATR